MPATSPSVLIVRLDAIGDALALTPLIAALRASGARVDAVLSRVNAQAFAKRSLDRVYLAGSPGLTEALRAQHYTHALIATEDAAGYRIARDARVPVRVGFQNGWGKPLKSLWVRTLCTEVVYRPAGLDPRGRHECSVLFELGRAIVGRSARPARTAAVLRPLVLDEEPASDTRLAIQVTSKWLRLGGTLDELADLARRAGSIRPIRAFGAMHEADFADAFERASGHPVERFANTTEWKAAIAAAPVLIAPDSGALHVAGMTGTPVVAAFASNAAFPLQTARWSPWAAPHALIRLDGAWPTVAADAAGELLSGNRAPYRG